MPDVTNHPPAESPATLAYFEGRPREAALYRALMAATAARCGAFTVTVQKTQIALSNRHLFAVVSLPYRRARGWPKECLLVSFGLFARLSSPRVVQAVEPYPNRWTHHVLVADEAQIDAELLDWLAAAYAFAAAK